MSAEENKAIVRQFYDEVVNKGNINMIDKIAALNYVDHTAPPGIPPGKEGEKVWFKMIRAAFPDGRTTIDDIIAEGDKVVVRATMKGTHKGEFMGIPATWKQVTISGIDVPRVASSPRWTSRSPRRTTSPGRWSATSRSGRSPRSPGSTTSPRRSRATGP